MAQSRGGTIQQRGNDIGNRQRSSHDIGSRMKCGFDLGSRQRSYHIQGNIWRFDNYLGAYGKNGHAPKNIQRRS